MPRDDEYARIDCVVDGSVIRYPYTVVRLAQTRGLGEVRVIGRGVQNRGLIFLAREDGGRPEEQNGPDREGCLNRKLHLELLIAGIK